MSSGSGSESGGERKKGKQQDQASLLQEIRALIQSSEERTVGRIDQKIDKLSDNLSKRLNSTEKDVKKLGRSVKEMKGDLIALQDQVNSEKEGLQDLVNSAVDRKVASIPKKQTTGSRDKKSKSYLEARRTLRVWPLLDLSDDVVMDFLVTKLGIPQPRADEFDFTAKRLTNVRQNDPDNQALVTFSSSRQRDEVKSAARNLTDKDVGVQMDPPDHLRSHYQAFQALAYQLKLKNPLLKRNVKFCDLDQSLEMDFNVGDGTWRTIGIAEARDALRVAKSRKANTTKKDLADLLGATNHADITDSSEDDEATMVEVSDSDDSQ